MITTLTTMALIIALTIAESCIIRNKLCPNVSIDWDSLERLCSYPVVIRRRYSVGDIGLDCEDDFDADGYPDAADICPRSSRASQTSFSSMVVLDRFLAPQRNPQLEFRSSGTEVEVTTNFGSTLVVGSDVFGGVDFRGSVYVNSIPNQQGHLGVVFSYQSKKKYFAFLWRKGNGQLNQARDEAGLELKLVDVNQAGSAKGDALNLFEDTSFGWKERTFYTWKLILRPRIGFIRMQVFQENINIFDSGNLFSSKLTGGRLGVYAFSRIGVTWGNLSARCRDSVEREIYDELPLHIQAKIGTEDSLCIS